MNGAETGELERSEVSTGYGEILAGVLPRTNELVLLIFYCSTENQLQKYKYSFVKQVRRTTI